MPLQLYPTADHTAQVRDALAAVGCLARVRRLRQSVRIVLRNADERVLAAGALVDLGRIYWNQPCEGFLHLIEARA